MLGASVVVGGAAVLGEGGVVDTVVGAVAVVDDSLKNICDLLRRYW